MDDTSAVELNHDVLFEISTWLDTPALEAWVRTSRYWWDLYDLRSTYPRELPNGRKHGIKRRGVGMPHTIMVNYDGRRITVEFTTMGYHVVDRWSNVIFIVERRYVKSLKKWTTTMIHQYNGGGSSTYICSALKFNYVTVKPTFTGFLYSTTTPNDHGFKVTKYGRDGNVRKYSSYNKTGCRNGPSWVAGTVYTYMTGTYVNNAKHGDFITVYPTGSITTPYVDGVAHGLEVVRDALGRITHSEVYKKGCYVALM